MTVDQKLVILRRMIDDDETETEDGILEVYLELAAQKILNRMYPYREEYEGLTVPQRYESIQLNVAAYMLNKRGAEGQVQHIENGVHRNYGSADVPNDMLNAIVPYCKVIL